MEGLIEGRIVHYVLENGAHRPAIIVHVLKDDGTVNLQQFTDGPWDGEPMGTVWHKHVHYSADKEPGTWHWIERE